MTSDANRLNLKNVRHQNYFGMTSLTFSPKSNKWIIMKQMLFLLMVFTYAFTINSCNKENLNHSLIENDSIALKYVDLLPDTTWMDLNGDQVKDICITDTTVLFFHGEPQDVFIGVTYIKSYNKNISISYGKLLQNNKSSLLDKDSIIDNSLNWVDEFLFWGPHNFFPERIDPNYIGIRFIKNDHTYFGWINNTHQFTEYALDTSAVVSNRKVYAGSKKK